MAEFLNHFCDHFCDHYARRIHRIISFKHMQSAAPIFLVAPLSLFLCNYTLFSLAEKLVNTKSYRKPRRIRFPPKNFHSLPISFSMRSVSLNRAATLKKMFCYFIFGT